jgi:hypothetical protein
MNNDLAAADRKEYAVLASALPEQELPDLLLECITLPRHGSLGEPRRDRRHNLYRLTQRGEALIRAITALVAQ